MVYDNNDGPVYSSIQSKGCPGNCVPYWAAPNGGAWTDRQGCIDNGNAPGLCDQCFNPIDFSSWCNPNMAVCCQDGQILTYWDPDDEPSSTNISTQCSSGGGTVHVVPYVPFGGDPGVC